MPKAKYVTLKTKSKRQINLRVFFVSDNDKEKEYETKAMGMIDALEEQWEDSYKPALHDTMVMELIRSEMMAFHYEQLLARQGGTETELTPMLLRQERIQVSLLRENLIISLKNVRKEEPPPAEGGQASLFELAEQAFEEKEKEEAEE